MKPLWGCVALFSAYSIVVIMDASVAIPAGVASGWLVPPRGMGLQEMRYVALVRGVSSELLVAVLALVVSWRREHRVAR